MLDAAVPTEDPILELPPASPEARRPRVWTVFVAFFAALVGAVGIQAAAVAVAVAWWAAQGAEPRELVDELPKKLGTVEAFIGLASCGQLAMVLTILIAAQRSPSPWRERLGLVPARSSRKVNLLAMLGSLVPLVIGFALAIPLSGQLPGDPSVQALLENLSPIDWVVFILFIATVPAVVEEILFRGYMQRRLLERWRPLTAIGVTSLLFAAMHVMPLAIVALLPLSVWLGVVAWRVGSVYPTMLCHGFINGAVNVWRMVVQLGELSETVQIVAVSVVLLGSLVCMMLACRELFGREVASSEGLSDLTENHEAVGG